MKKNKSKKNSNWLPASERPLFAPWHSVHQSERDKQRSRKGQKKSLRKEVSDYKNNY